MKYILTILIFCCALAGAAQNKFDFAALQAIEAAQPTDSLTFFVEFANADGSFGSLDVKEEARYGCIATVQATPAQAEQIAALPDVVSISGVQIRKPIGAGAPAVTKTSGTERRYVAPRSPGIFGGLKK